MKFGSHADRIREAAKMVIFSGRATQGGGAVKAGSLRKKIFF